MTQPRNDRNDRKRPSQGTAQGATPGTGSGAGSGAAPGTGSGAASGTGSGASGASWGDASQRMCRDSRSWRGEPVDRIGFTGREMAVLTVARHFFSSFAAPERQGWIAAFSSALASFGHGEGPNNAVSILCAVQAMRSARRSTFSYNNADCGNCARFVTGHERSFMAALRSTIQGRPEAARAHAALLCEGNDADHFLRALETVTAQCFPREHAAALLRPAPTADRPGQDPDTGRGQTAARA
ncbi:hypothetical protein [Psychromarinibacter sp. S121]|uniref:hypothetical protein n=1 Tax=Psychromarinibacter sp. S121 TaxID=3415127 RepID=UPI003C797ED1